MNTNGCKICIVNDSVEPVPAVDKLFSCANRVVSEHCPYSNFQEYGLEIYLFYKFCAKCIKKIKKLINSMKINFVS